MSTATAVGARRAAVAPRRRRSHRRAWTPTRAVERRTCVAPDGLVLAVVIVYPLVKAVIMSFQKDAGLDPATGLFVAGGFAGLSNYRHWLLQQCQTPAADPCPPGDHRLAVLPVALRHAVLHRGHRVDRDRARPVVRHDHEPRPSAAAAWCVPRS